MGGGGGAPGNTPANYAAPPFDDGQVLTSTASFVDMAGARVVIGMRYYSRIRNCPARQGSMQVCSHDWKAVQLHTIILGITSISYCHNFSINCHAIKVLPPI